MVYYLGCNKDPAFLTQQKSLGGKVNSSSDRDNNRNTNQQNTVLISRYVDKSEKCALKNPLLSGNVDSCL